MAFCSNCGSKLDDDAMFCSECGAPVSLDPIHSNSENSTDSDDTIKKLEIIVDNLEKLDCISEEASSRNNFFNEELRKLSENAEKNISQKLTKEDNAWERPTVDIPQIWMALESVKGLDTYEDVLSWIHAQNFDKLETDRFFSSIVACEQSYDNFYTSKNTYLNNYKEEIAYEHDKIVSDMEAYLAQSKLERERLYNECKMLDILHEDYFHLAPAILSILKTKRAADITSALNIAIAEEQEAEYRQAQLRSMQDEAEERNSILEEQAREEQRNNAAMEEYARQQMRDNYIMQDRMARAAEESAKAQEQQARAQEAAAMAAKEMQAAAQKAQKAADEARRKAADEARRKEAAFSHAKTKYDTAAAAYNSAVRQGNPVNIANAKNRMDRAYSEMLRNK